MSGTDEYVPEARSRNMAAIRGRDTRPELFIRRGLHARGFRFRIAPASIPGHPDLYLARYQAAIFVHGCFWHRHPGCRYAAVPATRSAFWTAKFAANVSRDAQVALALQERGIRRLVIWECAIRSAWGKNGRPEVMFDMITDFLRGDITCAEIDADALMAGRCRTAYAVGR